MTTQTMQAATSQTPTALTTSNNRLLRAGVIAGPLFIGVYAVQALLRDGYEPSKHPISLLANGDAGIVQILNFVITGVLVHVLATGVGRSTGDAHRAAATSRALRMFGTGLIIGGVFVADAGAGFPVGAPEGRPEMTTIGLIHEVGFGVAQLGFIATAVALRGYFAASGNRTRARRSVLALVAVTVVAGFPHVGSFAPRIVAASVIEFAFLAAVAIHFIRSPQSKSPKSDYTLAV